MFRSEVRALTGTILGLFLLMIVSPTPAQAGSGPGAARDPGNPEEAILANFEYDFPARTIVRFESLAEKARKDGDVDARATFLSQIARAEGLQNHLDRADELLDQAQTLAKSGARAGVRIERGRILRRRGHLAAARKQFVAVFQAADTIDLHPNLVIDAAHMLAIMSDGEEAERWSARGLALAEASPDPRINQWVGVLAWNLAEDYDDQGNHPRGTSGARSSVLGKRACAGRPDAR